MKEIAIDKNQTCHDCKKTLQINDQVVPYETNSGTFYKCKSCYEKDPVLRNFQKCEVYTRIVGYMRPVEQWNKGKAEEYKDRKVFKVTE